MPSCLRPGTPNTGRANGVDREGTEFELPNHGYSRGHQIFRVLANHWTVVRTAEGWRIKTRKLFPMDGSEPARALLLETVSK